MKNKRFVIQEHRTAEGIHWDLMLERDEVLTTFRLAEAPKQALAHPIRAKKIFDHPPRFLAYEGPVQKGTGRVHIVERGTYRCMECRDDRLVLVLDGAVLSSTFILARTGQAEWRFALESPNPDSHQSPR